MFFRKNKKEREEKESVFLSPKELFLKELRAMNEKDIENGDVFYNEGERKNLYSHIDSYWNYEMQEKIKFKTSWEEIIKITKYSNCRPYYNNFISTLRDEDTLSDEEKNLIDSFRKKREEEEQKQIEIRKKKEEDEMYTKKLEQIKKIKPLDEEIKQKIDKTNKIIKLSKEVEEKIEQINTLRKENETMDS